MRITNAGLALLGLPVLLGLMSCTTTVDGRRVDPPPQPAPALPALGSYAHSQTSTVTVSYWLEKDHPTLHEPIILNFKIENGRSAPVVVDLGANFKEIFSFTIRKPDGSKIELGQKIPEGSALIGRVPIESGQAYTGKLLLNEWFDFDAVGRYELGVRLVKPHMTPRGTNIYDLGDTPEFHAGLYINRRDATRLNEVCAGLEARILNASSVLEEQEPAQILSYVKDPVAIPYLEAVIKSSKMVQSSAIAGLERMGGDEAVRALKAASRNSNKDTAFWAARALDRLGKNPDH